MRTYFPNGTGTQCLFSTRYRYFRMKTQQLQLPGWSADQIGLFEKSDRQNERIVGRIPGIFFAHTKFSSQSPNYYSVHYDSDEHNFFPSPFRGIDLKKSVTENVENLEFVCMKQ
jgi:hypothetical protein